MYNRITNANVRAIEVDGHSTHEANPKQLARDALKNEICRRYAFPLPRLPTTGSGEADEVRDRWAPDPSPKGRRFGWEDAVGGC
ncbi:DUF2726 domain-containing protein [Nocardia sp. R6R-6]|uniref:DUF2726 domain-containing protein n=1 Tax=Nocardia sp. R6R-6 TaxID=3459303 RepID=UPI00403DAC67